MNTLYNNILNKCYKPTLSYPTRPERPEPPYMGSSREYRVYADALESYENQLEKFYIGASAYREEVNSCIKRLRQDLTVYYGFEIGPELAKVLYKAHLDNN
jgi:hypothetical protein